MSFSQVSSLPMATVKAWSNYPWKHQMSHSKTESKLNGIWRAVQQLRCHRQRFHCIFMQTKVTENSLQSQCKISHAMWMTLDSWHNLKIRLTSKMPCWRPIRPLTPASSMASLMAALRGSSWGSIPPPGTTQQSGRRWLVTNKIWWQTHSNNTKYFTRSG